MKKKIVILFLLGLLCSVSVFGQTYSSITSDKEIYNFLNWLTKTEKKHSEEQKLKRKRIFYKIIPWDTANFVTKDTSVQYLSQDNMFLFYRFAGTDTLFKKADRAFLFQQYTSIKDTIWHKRFSKSKLLKNKNQKHTNRYYYSIPLFSVNRNYVIIYIGYYCGNLCAYRGYYIFEKTGNKKWKYVTVVNSSMS